MHFIPNPNNTEFIYLLGLEAIVDRITHDGSAPPPPIPFVCSQCGTDFSSLWKWDKAATRKYPNSSRFYSLSLSFSCAYNRLVFWL